MRGQPDPDPPTPATLDPDPDEEATPRERLAAVVERHLDIPMALLAVAWAVLVAYELVAPAALEGRLAVAGNVIWGIFVAEFVLKLALSGRPLRFLRRRWPSLLFLVLPVLRLFRVLRAVRALRVLPAARVVGSSYRAAGTARGLLEGRLATLGVVTVIVMFGSGQLLYLLEAGRSEEVDTLADALWWSSHAVVSGDLLFLPATVPGRLLGLGLSAYAVLVFASLAGTLGAFFVESRAERAASEEGPRPDDSG